MTREKAIKIVKEFINGTCLHLVDQEALETLIPELKENEDERIRKSLYEFFDNALGKDLLQRKCGLNPDKVLTYLEKQKEHALIEPELKFPDWVHGNWDDGYMINTVIGIYSLHAEVARKRGDTHDYNLSKSMESWLRSVVKPLIVEKQKERGPLTKEEEYILHRIIEYLEDETCPSEWISLLHDIYCLPYEKYEEEKSEEVDESTKRLNDNWMKQHFDDYKEQSKATINDEPIPIENQSVDIPLIEWNEEDEMAFGDLMWCIKQAAKSAKDENDMGNVWFAENWVKNRLKSLRPQPIQLKEAYKDGFQTARQVTAMAFMNYLDENRPEGKMCLSNSECEEIEKAFLVGDWAKIERYFHKYQWKPSDDEERLINTSISFLKDFADKGYENAVECIDWLKSKLNGNTGKHWKPSEDKEPEYYQHFDPDC